MYNHTHGEVSQLHKLFKKAREIGLPIVEIDDGGEYHMLNITTREGMREAMEAADAVDVAEVYFYEPRYKQGDRPSTWVLLIWGNDPDELVADYTCNPWGEELMEGTFCN